ncbi:MAG: toxin-antitoxin system protein [Bacteroidaceae bacterium]|nr:toxin-antitoxin system protein [Bacteroidaceae bacterium]
MEATITRRPTSFRLRADLLEGLKRNAARQNRTLNNYVESVLLDIVYGEPNEVTKAAIKEAMSRKDYPDSELFTSAKDLFSALNAEIDEE